MSENTQTIDNLHKFGNEFQSKCVAALLYDKKFLEQILDILNVDYWESDANKWIVEQTIQYFKQYKDSPTMVVFKVKVDTIEMNDFRNTVIEQLKHVQHKRSDSDIKYVKETFLEFCKNQSLKNAMLLGVDYLKTGEYEKIRTEIDKALKAGAERNLGTDFVEDVDKWLSENARTCVKTNWSHIDDVLDGGLGKGELGIVMAPAGIGKCVFSNTKIEIQYEEIGIPIIGNSGNEYVIWIKPFQKYDMGMEMGELYGWQIGNIFS